MAFPVSMLTVIVIEASRLTLLIAHIGRPELLPASERATRGSAVALAAITVRADEEPALAGAALQHAQNDILSIAPMWHAPAAQALDKGGSILSRWDNTCGWPDIRPPTRDSAGCTTESHVRPAGDHHMPNSARGG
jgi:hypothetical protein